MNLSLYLSFIAAAGMLAILPGPGILFVLAQTTKGGQRAGISASLGTAIGGLFHVVAGAIGLSAIVYTSAIAFEIVKTLGALYLFFLAAKALRDNTDVSAEALSQINYSNESMKQGIITESLNPKTALFFLALVPQFVDPNKNVTLQFLVLGTTAVFLNTSVDLAVVFSSSALIKKLKSSTRPAHFFKYISAAGYAGLGILALKTSKSTT